MKKSLLVFILSSIFMGCNENPKLAATKNRHLRVRNIFETEERFKNLAVSKGIAEAFYAYADDNAVIKRENDTLIKGRENIKKYYSNPKFKNASVTWKADFVDVSDDGTRAYTYGKYVWTVTDSVGNKNDFKGVFHTVWKKQKDNSWKYVWD